MNYQVPRGTKDILPDDVCVWQALEAKARHIFSRYCFCEIRTPIFEHIDLFKRSLGGLTEIVQKQMFSFQQGSDHFVLRPEATASIARSYLEHNLGFGRKVQKLYYIGPMFRSERPQKGRLRQFHHIGVELIGSQSSYSDIEIIGLAQNLLQEFGISGHTFIINSLGCREDKARFAESLRSKLAHCTNDLCLECQERIGRNVFRVLDCKKDQCKHVVRNLRVNHDYLCNECKQKLDSVVSGISELGINFTIRDTLVRGLDYYSGVVFEVTHPDLGAQDALGAGGRYDYLFYELAKKEIGALGFAFGIERLLLALPEFAPEKKSLTYIIALGDSACQRSIGLAKEIRDAQLCCEVDYSQASLKSKLKEAHKLSARFVIILGDDELKEGVVTLRHMDKRTEKKIGFVSVIDAIRNG